VSRRGNTSNNIGVAGVAPDATVVMAETMACNSTDSAANVLAATLYAAELRSTPTQSPHSIVSIRARWPCVLASGKSQVTIGASSASARATHMAS
jgi:hypothetical protein